MERGGRKVSGRRSGLRRWRSESPPAHASMPTDPDVGKSDFHNPRNRIPIQQNIGMNMVERQELQQCWNLLRNQQSQHNDGQRDTIRIPAEHQATSTFSSTIRPSNRWMERSAHLAYRGS